MARKQKKKKAGFRERILHLITICMFTTDAFLLAGAFENFRKVWMEKFGLVQRIISVRQV